MINLSTRLEVQPPRGSARFQKDYPAASDYPLSISQRCGAGIIEWASYVISGDPDRPMKPRLKARAGAAAGTTALLKFENDVQEMLGVRDIVNGLIEYEGVDPKDIIILTRSDYNNRFSGPIVKALHAAGIGVGDPSEIKQMMAYPQNRRLIAAARICVDRDDSLAWAAVLELTEGIGVSFVDYVVERAT